MSEMNEAAKGVADAQRDQVVDGVVKMADAVNKKHREIDSKVDGLRKDFQHGLEGLEERFNKTSEDFLSRMDNLIKSRGDQLGAVAAAIMPGTNALQEVIPEETKAKATAFSNAAHTLKRTKGAKGLGDPLTYMATNEWFWLTALAQHRSNAGRAAELFERADKIKDALNEAHGFVQKAPLSGATPATGGNLIPTVTEAEIQRMVQDAGKLFPICRQVPMSTRRHEVPDEATAVTVNWIDEAGTLTGGEPTFGQLVLTAEKLAGRATMSIEVVQDSAPDLISFLLNVFTEAQARQLDFQAMMGSGSSPAITGIRNASGIVDVTPVPATPAALTWPQLVSLFMGAGESNSRDMGYWYCSTKGYTAILSLSDTQGMPIVHWGTFTRDTPAGTILGRPIVVSAAWDGTNGLEPAEGTDIVFGPPNKWLAGTRAGMTWEVTDQANWSNYQADARLIGRFAGVPAVGKEFAFLRIAP